MTDELKPCPFCGESLIHLVDWNTRADAAPCVKPLVWCQDKCYDRYCLWAKTILGDYRAVEEGGGFVLVGPDGKYVDGYHKYKRPKDAYPIAQADYDNRILAALEMRK